MLTCFNSSTGSEGKSAIIQSDDPLAGLTPDESCVMCNKLPAKACSRCRSSYYCSKPCQMSDWPLHKLLCKKFHQQPLRPSPAHRRAILFPVHEKEPKLVWVLCKQRRDEMGRFESAQVASLLGAENAPEATAYVQRNPRRNRIIGARGWNLGYGVAIKHRDTFLFDGSRPNQSIASAAMTSGMALGHTWMGPVVALRERTDETAVADITLGDFRHAVDYFVDYNRATIPEPKEISPFTTANTAGYTLRGVVIHCVGSIKLHGKRLLSQVEVPATHPICHGEGDLSPISRVVGLPVRLWKLEDIGEWLVNPPGWEEGNADAASNQLAPFLMMRMDPGADDWGLAPPCWNTDLGNVLMVGDDGQDLAVEDSALLCYFCKRKLLPLFEDSRGAGEVLRTKEEVLEFMTSKNMEMFREDAKAELLSGDSGRA
jgi:hypothetical protein